VVRIGIRFRAFAVVTMLCCLAAAGLASGPAKPSPDVEYVYHSLIPLGSETFSVQPWGSVLTVLASAENPDFEGWRQQHFSGRRRLLNAGGQPVRYFPDRLEFRVTTSTRTTMADARPFPLRTTLGENDYLLNLRFRLKIFHGLRQKIVAPEGTELIGVPADIPSSERIYRVSFDLGQVSMDDRVVLEVLMPSGERLCKFHLDL
jgi:hypothetical protein